MILFTEKNTRLIYEAKLFDEFVMVRPVSVGFSSLVERMSHLDFIDQYEEYAGLYSQIEEHMQGQDPFDPQTEVELL